MNSDRRLSRRTFVASGSLAGAGAVLLAYPELGVGAQQQERQTQRQTQTQPPGQMPGQRQMQTQGHMTTPVEDLTAQHGALGRLLLVYEETATQLQAGRQVSPKPIQEASDIIRATVIELHVPLEEQYVFPRLAQSGQYANVIQTLQQQHAAAREINSQLLTMAKSGSFDDPKQVAQTLNDFRRMLVAHVAREHSEIFPAFQKMMSHDEYMELGQKFQEKERSALGTDGFAGVIKQVASIEANLGLQDLSRFTAKVQAAPVAAAERQQERVATQP